MADVVASSILSFVSGKLGAKMMHELRLLKGVEEELGELETTLVKIQSVLEDAEACQVKEKSLIIWLKELKDVAFDIDDVLDEAAVEAVKNKKARTSSSLLRPIQFRHEIAHKIENIRKRLDTIVEERSKFQLPPGAVKHSTINDSEVDSGIRETGSFVNESEIYGRIRDKEQIINFLMDESVENNLRVMPIVGLGGLGKTTLAQLAYNDEKVSQRFEHRIWVYVSDKFDIKSIIKSIIASLTGNDFNLQYMDLMQQKLVKEISGTKFLLVLDDIWNENYELWNSLRNLLDYGDRGSKVIATTRSRRVGSIMGTEQPHLLTVLSEDDCWSLFEKRAFGGFAGSANYYQTLLSIGKEIVKKCGGLPLAAKALGSMMRFKREVSQWLDVRDNEIWRLFADDNHILPALMLSYNHLPSRLKQCFAYCSMFPKGYEVEIKSLAQMWVAEGFVRPSDHGSTDLEDVGCQYVEQLLSRSLLEKGRTYSDVDTVKMHDVVHDLATFVAGDECLIMDGNGNISGGSRYTSLMSDKLESFDALDVNHLHKLRSFYLIKTPGTICSSNEDEYQKFIGKIFSHMKLLRVLHLRGLPMNALPAAVNNFIHLRHLNLSSTHLETLHENIGLLYNLQSLNLRWCGYLKALPASIGDLVNLFTLNLDWCEKLRSLPDTIGRMMNLKTLDISGASCMETLPESIGDLVNLFTLNLSRCHKLHSLPDTIGRMVNLNILNISYASSLETLPESLSSLSNLQRLDLRYCEKLHELPKNIHRMRSLAHLSIDGCDDLTSMPVGIGQMCHLRGWRLPVYPLGDGESDGSLAELGSMKNLEGELHIRNLENARTVEEAREANLREKQGLHTLWLEYWGLTADEYLTIFGFLYAFKERIKALMDKAVALTMDANRTRLSEDVLESLQPPQNLKSLSIAGYVGRMMPGWITDSSVPNLEILQLKAFVRCEKLPASLEKFYCLKKLTLCTFPNIKCLPQLGQLPCLESLRLVMLPAVKCLGSELYGTGDGAFPALKNLIISYMLNLEEWRISGTDGERFLPRLIELNLLDCPKLTALPSTFPSVTRLIMNADDKMLLSSLEHGAFPNLNLWVVNRCKRDEDQLFMRMKSVESARKSRDSSFRAFFY